MKQRVLILGAKGMLGQALMSVFAREGMYEVIGWDVEDLDVTDGALAEQKILELAPDILLNTVAYNAVDACEEDDVEYEKALKLNAEVPGFLARLAKDMGALLVHYSTDYVFGQNDRAHISGYSEEDVPEPQCRYGHSKRLGEEAVIRECEQYYIVRLSKLFGKPASSTQGKRSFFDIMLELGKTREEVKVVAGEMSCFTFAPDLAQATRDLIRSGDPYGIYHLVNAGPATWYDGVGEFYRLAGITTHIVPVQADFFHRSAKRPEFSVLLNTKRPALRSYKEALRSGVEGEI
jgi:dTDP-4-dehydrorhamnose reductase